MHECPKCGGNWIEKAYDAVTNRLNFRCMGCGYVSRELPNDAKRMRGRLVSERGE